MNQTSQNSNKCVTVTNSFIANNELILYFDLPNDDGTYWVRLVTDKGSVIGTSRISRFNNTHGYASIDITDCFDKSQTETFIVNTFELNVVMQNSHADKITFEKYEYEAEVDCLNQANEYLDSRGSWWYVGIGCLVAVCVLMIIRCIMMFRVDIVPHNRRLPEMRQEIDYSRVSTNPILKQR